MAARAFLHDLFRIAVAAAQPDTCLRAHLPAPGEGRLIMLAAGKAAGAMTEVAERHYLDTLEVAEGRLHGIAVTRHGYVRPTRCVRVIEAGHPLPDAAGLAAAERTLTIAQSAGERLVKALFAVGLLWLAIWWALS